MRAKLLCAVVIAVVSSGLLVFCVGDDQNNGKDSGGDAQGNDAGSDAPPAQGFTINLAPSHVTADPGDSSIAITINVVRAQGFADDVAFTVTPPAHVTATNAVDTGNGGTSSSFSISVDGTAPLGDITLTVTAANPTKTFVQNANLGIHVGTLVDVGDGGITVPSWANALVVKAWGAGGGASCAACDSLGGAAAGGGGGFATGTVAVSPSSTLIVVVGTGGSPGSAATADAGCSKTTLFGAGGGGFSGLQAQGGSWLVIAGGGGGATYYGYGTDLDGGAGAGGGIAGEDATGQQCNGSGGTQTQGGTQPSDAGCNMGEAGTSLHGGDGYNWNACQLPVPKGGSPGGGLGGASGFGGGGGGGGYFGGGGGGFNTTSGNGGGGSGFVASDAGTLTTGHHAAPANTTDPDFAKCPSGSANGGAASTNGGVGANGCVVLRYTKP